MVEKGTTKKTNAFKDDKNNRGTSRNLVPFTPLRNLNTSNLEFVRQMGSLFTEISGDWKKLENAHHKRDVQIWTMAQLSSRDIWKLIFR